MRLHGWNFGFNNWVNGYILSGMELKEILQDRRSGAIEILKRAVNWLIEHPEALHREERDKTLECLRIERPAMSALARLAERVRQDPSPATLECVRAELQMSDSAIARNLIEQIGCSASMRIATLSWSTTVLAAVRYTTNCFSEIHVLESQPGGEGRRLADKLGRFHVHVRLHPDQDLEEVAGQCDMGLIGADTVFSEGAVVNKVLSVALAESLKRQGKPLYVLASRWKLNDRRSADFQMDAGDGELFEVVPADRITGIVNEDGVIQPAFIKA